MKSIKPCNSINDIREAVKAIDSEIIKLFSERTLYVVDAVRFKTVEDIKTTERTESFLQIRCALAEQHRVDPQLIRDIYKVVLANSKAVQWELWKSGNAVDPAQ